MNGDTGSRAGFSLLELIVCLGLLALLGILAASGLETLRQGAGLVARAEDEDRLRAVEAFLRRDLERAEPLFRPGPEGFAALAFSGTAERIGYVVRSDGRFDEVGPIEVEIAVAPAKVGETPMLIVRRGPAGGKTDPEPRPLMPAGDGWTLRYFGPTPTADAAPAAPQWQESWIGRDRLPALVEITLPADPVRRPWPPIVVPLRKAGPS